MKNVIKKCSALLILTLSIATVSASAEPVINDSVAIGSLTQAKGVFLLDFNGARKTAKYLKLITGTHQRFLDQGVEPDLVLVFFGPTVQFLTTEPRDEIALQYGEHLEAITNSISDLRKLGVRMEVCHVANKALGVDPNTLHPGLTAVADGAISLIGWQYQGYKLVPVF